MSKRSISCPSRQVECVICLDVVLYPDTQQLTCEHRFCSTCMSLCLNLPTCPQPGCGAARTADVLVDEMDNEDDNDNSLERMSRISFGPNMLQLEERQRCEAHRGVFQCVNVARMTLVDCHHRVCSDCLAKQITVACSVSEKPHCPVARCANFVSRSEAIHLSQMVLSIAPIVKNIADSLPNISDVNKPTLKDEVRIFCSVYGANDTTKILNVPKVCTVADMVTALMQMLRVDRNRSASSIGVFMRTEVNNKIRYEPLNVKNLNKKAVKDANVTEKTHFVLDLNNEIHR